MPSKLYNFFQKGCAFISKQTSTIPEEHRREVGLDTSKSPAKYNYTNFL
jgi:hypothetical protein